METAYDSDNTCYLCENTISRGESYIQWSSYYYICRKCAGKITMKFLASEVLKIEVD